MPSAGGWKFTIKASRKSSESGSSGADMLRLSRTFVTFGNGPKIAMVVSTLRFVESLLMPPSISMLRELGVLSGLNLKASNE
jgi:hypothetical protein